MSYQRRLVCFTPDGVIDPEGITPDELFSDDSDLSIFDADSIEWIGYVINGRWVDMT